MPRIKGLGQIDWEFGLTAAFCGRSIANPSPVVVYGNGAISNLRFIIKLEAPTNIISEGWDRGNYSPKSRFWWGFKGHASRLQPVFRMVLERLAHQWSSLDHLDHLVGEDQQVLIGLSFMDVEPHLEIDSYSKFLESLARRMSKWWKEAVNAYPDSRAACRAGQSSSGEGR